MALISVRSPFFVNNEGFDEGATLTVEIGTETAGVATINETYTLNFRKQTDLDISQLIRPELNETDRVVYVKTTVSGEISGVLQSDVVAEYTASEGYFEYEDGYNKDFSTEIYNNCFYVGSSDILYKLDDENIEIPLFNAGTQDSSSTKIHFMLNGEIQKTVTDSLGYSGGNFTTNQRFKTISSSDYDNFAQRASLSGYTLEDSICLRDFFDQYRLEDYDEIRIERNDGTLKIINVETVEECKYTPYRIEYLNKYGLPEQIVFYKRSDRSLRVERENYRANTLSSYKSGSLANHVYKDYNVNGRETMNLNTDWLPESFYESFKQMYLSENVWIWFNDEKLPVNVKNSELKEKKHVNEKVISYQVEVEFAFDKIGNIV